MAKSVQQLKYLAELGMIKAYILFFWEVLAL
jgi:hypothetical protein